MLVESTACCLKTALLGQQARMHKTNRQMKATLTARMRYADEAVARTPA